MSSHLKAELAATCSTLGRLHKGEYLIEPDCVESVKDLIRYLKRDDETHEIRRYLGESKVLQNDLVHIIKSCPEENSDLFDVTLRLLINLTTPATLFYRDEMPTEKISRNIYLSLNGYGQSYKVAFCDVEFWSKVCGKLTSLFEIDWTERSADDGIQIERILMLLRNVLQIPADQESEKVPDNDITVHDKVLWALRQSQILELLLFLTTNRNEEQYFLNLLEIFSLVLREQNPKILAQCDIQRSEIEKVKDAEDLVKVRQCEKNSRNKYLSVRNFSATFVMKGVKSLSNNDVVCHKFLDDGNILKLNSLNKKQIRTRKNRIPVESEGRERRSTVSTRLFLKEFCCEFLAGSFNTVMQVTKNKLASGKTLADDQNYYFWAMKFFLEFAVSSNSDVTLIHDLISAELFHFVQMSMDEAFERLILDKKKTANWVKRIHLILKAYRSLLETLLWMDCSNNALARSISREIKSQIFFVTEYREMILHILLRYDSTKFSVSFLRDIIETAHLFIKLLEDYSKQTKLVVQEVVKKKRRSRGKKKVIESREEKWEKIKIDVYNILCSEQQFPEIPPFDAASDTPIDDQKETAMKNIQKLLHLGKIADGIGLFRSARQVWPENECFGSKAMSIEDEVKALQEICIANLCEISSLSRGKDADEDRNALEKEDQEEYQKGDEEVDEEEAEEKREEENRGSDSEDHVYIVEKDFDIMDYKRRLASKKIIEGCGTLLKNYEKNSNHTNHCIIKLLYRIGWECCMPAMLYQASLFWTLLKILQNKSQKYNEINTFTMNLIRKFRKHAAKNPIIFLELLFWKDYNVALEIQHGYASYQGEEKTGGRKKNPKNKVEKVGKRTKRKQKKIADSEVGEQATNNEKKNTKKQKSYTNSVCPDEFRVFNSTEDEDEASNFHNTGRSKTLFEDSDSDVGEVSSALLSMKCKSTEVHTNKKDFEGIEKTCRTCGCNDNIDNDKEFCAQNGKSEKCEHPKNFVDKQVDISSEEEHLSGFHNENETEISRKTFHTNCPDPEFREVEVQKEQELQSENFISGKADDSCSTNNQTKTLPKERIWKMKSKRNFQLSGEDFIIKNPAKSKRFRHISSDSDNSQSEEESLLAPRKKRWRNTPVIDSDSDVEAAEDDINIK